MLNVDSDKLLEEIRTKVSFILQPERDFGVVPDDEEIADAAKIMADAFQALDNSLSSGGFLPKKWL